MHGSRGPSLQRARCLQTLHRVATSAVLLVCGACSSPQTTVLLIGGPDSEGPGFHDYPDGVRELQAMLADVDGVDVIASPDAWPTSGAVFDRADTIVLYFDGHDAHPLRDPKRRAQFERAMRRGAGLVALHQASTAPGDDDLGLPNVLGAVREGFVDRTTEWTTVSARTPTHPLTEHVAAFDYRDEFYPTLRFATKGGNVTPLLQATLYPQFRDGAAVLMHAPETATVAWAFERTDGGRAVGYTGAHYLDALREPGLRQFLRNAIFWTARHDVEDISNAPGATAAPPSQRDAPQASPPQPGRAISAISFHVDSARSGWRDDETTLSRALVASSDFGQRWESPPLATRDGQPPRLYATPLFVPALALGDGPHRGIVVDAVIAATSNGDVYAINTSRRGDLVPGRVLWHRHLGDACRLQPAPLDGVPTGILSTPVIDRDHGRLYVTHCDPDKRWQAYALDLHSGALLPGWPVRLDEDTLNTHNRNAGPNRVPPTRRFDFRVQRGALNLSPDGTLLYVVFGETETGWLVAVDTREARIGSTFATAAMPHRSSGGLWGAGGPAVDSEGNIYIATGTGYNGYVDAANDWTQSVLKLAPDAQSQLALLGTYTPFNHCGSATNDIDLGSGGVVLLPPADAPTHPRLLALGGKQGNLYLLDRDALPGALDRRPACSTDASSDASLLAPHAQPQFGTPGPLNVFGPYSETDAALDLARARSVPATFRDAAGKDVLFVTGNTKRAAGVADSVPPSLVRVAVVREGDAVYPRIDRSNDSIVFGNPGSPVVTSHGSDDAIVWVLDENASRSALLSGADAPKPRLYAFDADTLDVLWASHAGELETSGKYNTPAFGGGQVYVGTDRIQAFGAGGRRVVRAPQRVAAAPVETPVTDTAAPVDSLDGADIYTQRCAMCHDHAQGNIPPRSLLATRPHQRIVDALTHGVMRPQAAGLSAEQIDRVARHLTDPAP